MKSLVNYNNNASNRKALRQRERFFKCLTDSGIKYDLVDAESGIDAQNKISVKDFSEYDSIISVGGDGSLFHVVNGYMRNGSEKRIPIGVIPIGTGNAFSIDLGLEAGNIESAVETIKSGLTKETDVGLFRTEGKELYFVNILGLGFVTDVGITAGRIKALGNISYTLGVLYRTIFLNYFKSEIEHDGESLVLDTIFIEVSNSRYTGKDFVMAPEAEIDDGLLDVTIMKKAGRGTLLTGLPKIFTGSHVNMKEVVTFKAANIKIAADPPKTLTPDGEILGSTPIEIKCLKKKIEFFTR